MSAQTPDRKDPPDPFDDPLFPCEDIEDMFETHRPFGRSETGFLAGRSFHPTANIYESPDGLIITLEIPGIDRKDVDLKIEGNRLMVSGSRHFVRDHPDEKCIRIERGFGSFRRVFEIPADTDPDRITAKLDLGVLTIEIPMRSRMDTPCEIRVESGEDTK